VTVLVVCSVFALVTRFGAPAFNTGWSTLLLMRLSTVAVYIGVNGVVAKL